MVDYEHCSDIKIYISAYELCICVQQVFVFVGVSKTELPLLQLMSFAIKVAFSSYFWHLVSYVRLEFSLRHMLFCCCARFCLYKMLAKCGSAKDVKNQCILVSDLTKFCKKKLREINTYHFSDKIQTKSPNHTWLVHSKNLVT